MIILRQHLKDMADEAINVEETRINETLNVRFSDACMCLLAQFKILGLNRFGCLGRDPVNGIGKEFINHNKEDLMLGPVLTRKEDEKITTANAKNHCQSMTCMRNRRGCNESFWSDNFQNCRSGGGNPPFSWLSTATFLHPWTNVTKDVSCDNTTATGLLNHQEKMAGDNVAVMSLKTVSVQTFVQTMFVRTMFVQTMKLMLLQKDLKWDSIPSCHQALIVLHHAAPFMCLWQQWV